MAKLGYEDPKNFFKPTFYIGRLYECRIYDGCPDDGGKLKETISAEECAKRTREREENRKKRGYARRT